jgi:ABC-2 type transport system ATP-binding protein
VRSGLDTADSILVLAAGVGLRHRSAWLLRSVSFRVNNRPPGGLVLGIATSQQATASAVVNLLAGLARPAHGELRVLGKDLTTAAGRGTVRRRVGIARSPARQESAFRIRGMVERAARTARIPGRDPARLAAAMLDRLALTPWAEMRLSAAPRAVGYRARLAAAAVHGPELLLLDGLLDGLAPRERASVAAGVRELARDSVVIAAGSDATTLRLTCDEVLTLSDGILAAT